MLRNRDVIMTSRNSIVSLRHAFPHNHGIPFSRSTPKTSPILKEVQQFLSLSPTSLSLSFFLFLSPTSLSLSFSLSLSPCWWFGFWLWCHGRRWLLLCAVVRSSCFFPPPSTSLFPLFLPNVILGVVCVFSTPCILKRERVRAGLFGCGLPA